MHGCIIWRCKPTAANSRGEFRTLRFEPCGERRRRIGGRGSSAVRRGCSRPRRFRRGRRRSCAWRRNGRLPVPRRSCRRVSPATGGRPSVCLHRQRRVRWRSRPRRNAVCRRSVRPMPSRWTQDEPQFAFLVRFDRFLVMLAHNSDLTFHQANDTMSFT